MLIDSEKGRLCLVADLGHPRVMQPACADLRPDVAAQDDTQVQDALSALVLPAHTR